MSVADDLRARLAVLAPLAIEITDDSAKHARHVHGGGAHLRLTIVSPHFAGLAAMARHRLVYEAAGDLMNGPIHALSVEARSPDEM